MQSITFKHDADTAEELHHEAEQRGFDTRSDYLRHIVDQRGEAARIKEEYEQKLADLQTEHDRELTEHEQKLEEARETYEQQIHELEQEIDRVQREKRMILEQREEHTELVRAVKNDQTLQQRKAEAPIWKRWKWSITGMPSD